MYSAVDTSEAPCQQLMSGNSKLDESRGKITHFDKCRIALRPIYAHNMPSLGTSSAAEAVEAVASCASRDAACIFVERILMAGAASGLASTRQPASSGERELTSASMHTISSAARRPCVTGMMQTL